MEKHVIVVGILRIGFAIFGILAALIVLFGTILPGIISGDREALVILSTIGVSVAFFLVIFSLPGLIGGIWLLRYKQWARYLSLVLAVIDLMFIPIGTVAGAYMIWVLVQDQTAKLFEPATS